MELGARSWFNQNPDRSNREKWSTSKGRPVFSKLFQLDRTDPLSFGPKFPEILGEWIAPDTYRFYRNRSRSVWIACFWLARKTFFWPISEEKQPGDSRVSLHDVVFLIDRHSGLARSSAKVSEQNVNNLEKLQPLARLQETNTLRWIFTADLSKVS